MRISELVRKQESCKDKMPITNHIGKFGIYKGMHRFDAEKKGNLCDPPITYVPRPSLIDVSETKLRKVELLTDPENADSPKIYKKLAVAEAFTAEDFVTWEEDMLEYIKYKPIVQPMAKFVNVQMFLAGEAKANWKVQEARVTKQVEPHASEINEDGTPKMIERGHTDASFKRTMREFKKIYIKTDYVRKQKQYLRYCLTGPKLHTVAQQLTRIEDINQKLTKFDVCTDATPLLDYEVKDVLMNNQKLKWQSDVKINHEYELLTSQELETILTQFETNEGIMEAQEANKEKSSPDNQINKRKTPSSFHKDSSDSNRPNKKNRRNNHNRHRSDIRSRYCAFCAKKGKGFRTVHSHNEVDCRAKKGEQNNDEKRFKKKSEQMFALVSNLQKKVKKLEQKDSDDE